MESRVVRSRVLVVVTLALILWQAACSSVSVDGGQAKLARGDYEGAIEELSQVIGRGGDQARRAAQLRAKAYAALGDSLRDSGDLSSAAVHYTKALADDSSLVSVRDQLSTNRVVDCKVDFDDRFASAQMAAWNIATDLAGELHSSARQYPIADTISIRAKVNHVLVGRQSMDFRRPIGVVEWVVTGKSLSLLRSCQ